MKTKKLGKTQTTISAIGLGVMPLSLSSRPPEEQSLAVIHRALDLGITFIDTADSYCKDEKDKHHSEHLVHKALTSYAGDAGNVCVATKGGLMRPGGDWTRNSDPRHLRTTIRESFEALGGETPITLWQWHAVDPNFSIENSLEAVKEAVDEGLIKYVGLSNVSVEQIEQVRKAVDVVSIQNQYNPWCRDPETDGVLKYCEKEELTFFPWSPLGGSRRVKSIVDFPELCSIARTKGITPHRLVLAWMINKSPCIVPIPSATKLRSIEDSVAALEVRLSEEEMRQVQDAF